MLVNTVAASPYQNRSFAGSSRSTKGYSLPREAQALGRARGGVAEHLICGRHRAADVAPAVPVHLAGVRDKGRTASSY